MNNPVEGIHYIFDRYAFLNSILTDNKKDGLIDETSTPEEIAKVIKYGRVLFHPDRQERSGEKMKREAEKTSKLIDDCERILTNSDIKPHYDEKLISFRKNKPYLVSSSGNPIIDLSTEILDVESLLSDEVKDTSALEARIKALTTYDDKETEQTSVLYKSMPDNAQIRAFHRSALTKKLTYLTLLEDTAWLKIGISGRSSKIDGHLESGDEYLAKVDEALKAVSSGRIEEEFYQRGETVRIGMNTLPLLLEFNQSSQNSDQAVLPTPDYSLATPEQLREALDKLKVKARANFEIRAEYARDIARQKQTVLEELVSLAPITALNEHDASSPHYDFYLTDEGDGDDASVLLRFELDVSTGKATVAEFFLEDRLSVVELMQRTFTRNSLRVERNSKITEILIEVNGVANRVFNENKHRFIEKTAHQLPAPQP